MVNEKSDTDSVSTLPGTIDISLPKKPVKENGSKRQH